MRDDIYFCGTKGKYGWLSNFFPSPFSLGGETWETAEHCFQAAKTFDANEKEEIRLAFTPAHARILGRRCKLRDDWEDVKETFMFGALHAKFYQSKTLGRKLLATEDRGLHESSPRDMYWGVAGKDRLGKLLEQLREELQ